MTKSKWLTSHPFWIALCLLFGVSTMEGQTVLWQDDFGSGQTSGNNWSVIYSNDCDNPGIFGTSGGFFVINDMEGSNCTSSSGAGDNDNRMLIGPIDISSAECVQVRYVVGTSGDFEPFGTEGGDLLEITVRIDGANTFVANTFLTGSGALPGSTVDVTLPFSGDDLTIEIRGGNKQTSEFFFVGEMEVLDVTVPVALPPISECVDEVVDLTFYEPSGVVGTWSGTGVSGTTWTTFGLSAGTYPLTFTPVVGQCAAPTTVNATLAGGSLAGSATLTSCGSGGTAIFDLTDAESDIGPGTIAWFTDPLKLNLITQDPENYIANDNDRVYGAYVENGSCFSDAGTVILRVTEPSEPEPPSDVEACDSYTLPSLSGQSYADYNNGDVITTTQRIIIEEGVGLCRDTASFLVTINNSPQLDAYAGPTEACDSLQLPAISGTNLSGNEAYFTQSGGLGDRYEAGEYYSNIGLNNLFIYDEANTCSDEETFSVDIGVSAEIFMRDTIVCDTFAFIPFEGIGNFIGFFSNPGGTGTQYQIGDGIKRTPGDFQYFVRAGSGNCISEEMITVTFRDAPDIASISSFDVCGFIDLPSIAGDRLSGNEAYYTDTSGTGIRVPVGTRIDTSVTLYVYDQIGSCSEELLFTVLVIDQPELDSIGSQVACDTFVLPSITGQNLSGTQAYWTDSGGTGTVYDPGDEITTSQRLYVYDERARCNDEFSIEITVNTQPNIDFPTGDSSICDTFILPVMQGSPLTGNEVYTTMPLGQGDTLMPGSIFTDSTQIYLYAGVAGCEDSDSLQLFIDPQPSIDPLVDSLTCDFFVLPIITGTNLTAAVAYYDGPGASGNQFFPGDTIRNAGIYYAFDSTGIGCIAEDTFQIDIGITPIFTQVNDTVACTLFELPSIQGSNLNAPQYSSEPLGAGILLSAGDTIMASQRIFLYDENQGCFDSTSFQANVIFQTDIILGFVDTNACDTFILPSIIGDNLTLTEAYYTEPNGMGTRFDPGDAITNSIQLYVYGGLDVCVDEDTIQINILPTPTIDPLANVEACDFYVLPIITGTNLNGGEAYFDSDMAGGQRFFPGDTIRTSQTLFIYDESAICTDLISFDIQINVEPDITGPTGDLLICDSYTLPSIQGNPLTGNEVYSTMPLGQGDTILAGAVFTDTTTIYLYAGVPGCEDSDSLRLFIEPQPIIDPLPDAAACDFFVLPIITGANLTTAVAYYDGTGASGSQLFPGDTIRTGGTYYIFDSTLTACVAEDTFDITIGITSNLAMVNDTLSCTSFELPPIQGNNLTAPRYSTAPLGGGTLLFAGDSIFSSQRIYIYDEDQSCIDTTSFQVEIVQQTDIMLGFVDSNNCDAFVLPTITGQNLSITEAYFTEPNGMGTRFAAGDVLTDSIQLYVYGGNAICIDQDTLQINIIPTPLIDPIANVQACDFYVLPPINGSNLTGNEAYYINNVAFNPGDTIRVNSLVSARDTNAFACATVVDFVINITLTPQLANYPDQEVCDFFELPEIQGTFIPASSTLSSIAGGNVNVLSVGDILTSSDTIQIIADSLGCRDEASFVVAINYTPQISNAIGDTLECDQIELVPLSGSNLSANTAYYSQANGLGSPINLPLTIEQDTTLYLFGNNETCIASDTIDIVIKRVEAQLSISDTIECNGDVGAIELSIVNGDAPFTISWNNSLFNGLRTLNNLSAGEYAVEIFDLNGCSYQDTLQLVEPSQLDLSCNVVQQVTNPNGSDAIAQLNLDGGTAPYQVFISGAIEDTINLQISGLLSLENLAAGDYALELRDSLGCTQNCSFTITAPPCLLNAELTSSDISCFGEQDGQINLNIQNAQAPLSIDWNVDSLDGRTSLSDLNPGFYEVIVVDSFGCSDTANTNILEPTELMVRGSEAQPVSDNVSNDGVASFMFSGGTAPYQIIWDGPVTDTLQANLADSLGIANLPPGVYIFGAQDANGCIKSETITITNPNCGMTINFIKADQSCANTIDGQLIAEISGGVGPYTFIWEDGNRDSIRSGLDTGRYNLTVLDSETCIAMGSDTIAIANPLPSVSITVDATICEATCNAMQVQFTGTGPFVGAYELMSNSGDILRDTLVTDSANTNLDLCWDAFAGSDYSFSLIRLDDANCGIDVDTTIRFELLRNDTNYIRNTICENDSLIVEGTRYDINNPRDTIILAAQAASACDSIIVIDLSFTPLAFASFTDTICQEDGITINGTPYNFNNPVGTEIFAGQAANGCDSILQVELFFFPVDTSFLAGTYCVGEVITVGNASFDASNPDGFASIIDGAANGCDSIVQVDFTFVNEFTSSLVDTICAEDQIRVNGTIYDFNNPLGTETFTAVGGCDSIVSVSLSFFPIDTTFLSPSLCPGDSLVVNGMIYNENNLNGIEILENAAFNGCDSVIRVDLNYLENANSTFDPSICITDTVLVNGNAYHFGNPSGTEILENQASNGCDSIVNIDLQFFQEIRTSYTDQLCALDSIVVNGTVYNSANPSGTERILGAGQNACDSIVEIDLQFLPLISGNLEGAATICQGTSTELVFRLQGDTEYEVMYLGENGQMNTLMNIQDGHRIEVSPSSSTDYQLIAVRGMSNNCEGIASGESVSIVVSELDVLINPISDFNGFGVSCSGANDGQLALTTNGGIEPLSINWSNGADQFNISNLAEGSFSVEVIDAAGCTGADTFQLIAPDPINLDVQAFPSICPDSPNGTIQINDVGGGTGDYEYTLDGQVFVPLGFTPIVRGGLDPGVYPVAIRDANNCILEQPLTVGEESLFINLGPDTTIKIGDSVRLMADANFDLLNFSWTPTGTLDNPGSSQPFASPERTTAYTLMAIDSSGCTVSDNITVFVDQTRDVYMPTAFTPNEDGINDRFTIFGGPDLITIEELLIFDRWGNLMYREANLPASNDQFGWNGEFKGELMSSGSYVFRAVLRFSNGDQEAVEGEVALIR